MCELFSEGILSKRVGFNILGTFTLLNGINSLPLYGALRYAGRRKSFEAIRRATDLKERYPKMGVFIEKVQHCVALLPW